MLEYCRLMGSLFLAELSRKRRVYSSGCMSAPFDSWLMPLMVDREKVARLRSNKIFLI